MKHLRYLQTPPFRKGNFTQFHYNESTYVTEILQYGNAKPWLRQNDEPLTVALMLIESLGYDFSFIGEALAIEGFVDGYRMIRRWV